MSQLDASALKVKKAPPKAKKEASATPIDLTFLSQLSFFKNLDDSIKLKLIPKMQLQTLARGDVLFDAPPVNSDKSPVYMLIKGDISIKTYTKEQKENQLDGQTVNYLTVDEFYIEKLATKADSSHIEIKAMCPIEVLCFSYQELNYLFSKDKAFRDQFAEMIQVVIERQVTRFDRDFQKEISSFFVQERLTFSRRVKIKRMDICIECDGCYDACRDRHGTDRLGGSEVKFGITEIPQNCHNCVVPECIDKCKFGHISRHEKTNEIVISDNCIGCTQCSRGCSFGAIRMHPIESLDLEKYFPDRKPDAKGKNIAQKCDNCSDYEDRACITACPTGALFQVDGPDLFDYWEQFTVHQNPGFTQIVTPEDTVNRLRPYYYWFTMINLFLIAYETLSRIFVEKYAFGYLLYEWGIFATPFEKAFTPGNGFGHFLGYTGGVFMILTQSYTIGKLYAPKWGSLQQWMEVHIWCGFLGFIYGGAHSIMIIRNFFQADEGFFGLLAQGKLFNTEVIALLTFVLFSIAMFTGMIGRYLVYQLPRGKAEMESDMIQTKQQIENLFIDRREAYTVMSQLEKEQTALYAKEVKEEGLENQKNEKASDAKEGEGKAGNGIVQKITQLSLKKQFQTIRQYLNQNKEEAQHILSKKEQLLPLVKENQIDLLLSLLMIKAKATRSIRRFEQLSKILKSYKVIHISVGHITFLALLLHILRSFHLL